MEYKTTEKITEGKIAEVLRIKKEKGLTAESLLQEARNKKNPLHDLFDWDDTEAAEKWRLQQARVFINEIKIIIDTKEYYAFENVSVTVSKKKGADICREYKDMAEIKKSPDLRQQIVDSAYSQLLYWKSKYEQYNFVEFRNIIEEIDAIKPRIKVEV